MCSLLFILLLTTPGKAGDLASSFKQAAALADAENRTATEVYTKHDLLPYYKQKYFPVFQSCLAPTQHPDTTPFSFVAALGADGRVMRLYIDHETNVFACVRQTLQNDEFPHPPVSPYYWHVSMNFSQQQAQVQISSRPAGADIEIDGNYSGSTPFNLEHLFWPARDFCEEDRLQTMATTNYRIDWSSERECPPGGRATVGVDKPNVSRAASHSASDCTC
jgi:hypothetical protein